LYYSHEIFTPKEKIIILLLKSDLDVIDVKFDMAYYNVCVTTKHTTNIRKSFDDTISRVAASLDAGIAVTG